MGTEAKRRDIRCAFWQSSQMPAARRQSLYMPEPAGLLADLFTDRRPHLCARLWDVAQPARSWRS
jgi:hypothetical protein